jgi:thioredoxin reductase
VFDNGATLAPETLALMAERGVDHVPGPLARFEHEGGRLRAVATAAGRRVALDAFYLASRSEPASDLAASLGCAMSAGHTGPFVTVDEWQKTTVKGVYAAGDLSRQMPAAIFAASTGATAGLACDMDLAGLM